MMTHDDAHGWSITINGDGYQRADATVSDCLPLSLLLEDCSIKGRVAVAVNGAVVLRGSWEECQIFHGDKIEIVHGVVGG